MKLLTFPQWASPNNTLSVHTCNTTIIDIFAKINTNGIIHKIVDYIIKNIVYYDNVLLSKIMCIAQTKYDLIFITKNLHACSKSQNNILKYSLMRYCELSHEYCDFLMYDNKIIIEYYKEHIIKIPVLYIGVSCGYWSIWHYTYTGLPYST